MPMSSRVRAIISVSTMSSAPRLLAKATGEKSRIAAASTACDLFNFLQ